MTDVRRFALPVALALLLLPAACVDADRDDDAAAGDTIAAGDTADITEEPEGLGDARGEYLSAWNEEDAAVLGAFFTENATARVDGESHSGRSGIISGWLRDAVVTVEDLEVDRTRGERRGNDWYEEGTYRFDLDDEAPADTTRGARADTARAAAPPTSGRYTATWIRDTDGRWRIRSAEIMSDTTRAPADTARPGR